MNLAERVFTLFTGLKRIVILRNKIFFSDNYRGTVYPEIFAACIFHDYPLNHNFRASNFADESILPL